MEGEARRALPGLYKKYGITDKGKGPPKRKKKKSWVQTWMQAKPKKKKSWLQGFLDRFKRKKKKRRKIHHTTTGGVRG